MEILYAFLLVLFAGIALWVLRHFLRMSESDMRTPSYVAPVGETYHNGIYSVTAMQFLGGFSNALDISQWIMKDHRYAGFGYESDSYPEREHMLIQIADQAPIPDFPDKAIRVYKGDWLVRYENESGVPRIYKESNAEFTDSYSKGELVQ